MDLLQPMVSFIICLYTKNNGGINLNNDLPIFLYLISAKPLFLNSPKLNISLLLRLLQFLLGHPLEDALPPQHFLLGMAPQIALHK